MENVNGAVMEERRKEGEGQGVLSLWSAISMPYRAMECME